MHSLTFTPGSIQKTAFLLLSRPPWSISACKQVEVAQGKLSFKMYCASTVLLTQGSMAPIVLLVASCTAIVKFF